MTKKTNFKKSLLASASVLAIGAFAAGQGQAKDYDATTVNAISSDPGQVVNYTANVTLSVADNVNLLSTSGVTTIADGTGTLTFLGSSTVSGPVGTSTKRLASINAGAAGETDTFNGDVYANTTHVGVGGVNLNGNLTGAVVFDAAGSITIASGKSITGTVTGTGGNITTSGSSSFSTLGTSLARLGAFTASGAAGSTASFAENAYFTTLSAAGTTGTISIAAGKTLSFSSATSLGSNATYSIGIKKDLSGGTDAIAKITSDLAMTVNGAKLYAVVDGESAIAVNDTFTVITGTSITGSIASVDDNSYLLKFTAGTSADLKSIVLTAAQEHALSSVSTAANTQNVGAALQSIGNKGDANLDALQATLQGYSSATQIDSALKTLSPDNVASGSTSAAVAQTSSIAVGTVEHRIDIAMNESSATGVATGGHSNSNGLWGEVFGSTIDQDDRKGVAGYQANVGGFSIGADTLLNSQTRVGAAFAYGKTGAEGTGNKTDVDTYQGSVYGSYDLGKLYYEAVGTFAYNDYSTKRNLFDGSVANGSYGGQQYDAKATAGYKVDTQLGLKVTPFVSAEYAFITQDSYTETGSSANLAVSPDDISIFKTGLGAKLAYPLTDGGMTYTPRLSAAYYYDFVGDEASSTSNFSSTSTTFVTKGASVARNSFRLGAGLDVLAQDNVTLSLDYNLDAKQDFNAHTGELKARFEF